MHLLAEVDLMHRLASRLEKVPVEIGKELRGAAIVGRDAAAQPLQNFAARRAIGDAKARRHQCRGYPLQIGELYRRALDPMDLALLQHQIPGDHLGDPVRARPRGAIGFEQKIRGGGGETKRRQRGDTQGQPELQIKPGRGHGEHLGKKGLLSTARARRNLEAGRGSWKRGPKDRAICPAFAGASSLSGRSSARLM